MNASTKLPMDRWKLAEAEVRSLGYGNARQRRKSVKVLLCGASSERLAELSRFLAAFDYETVTARSAETALAAAREHSTQIAIWLETEVTARRGVLIEAARRLREIVPGAESIAIGPTDDHIYSAATFDAGVYNCMGWPVDYGSLARDLEFLSLEAQRRRELRVWVSQEREVRFAGIVGGSAPMRRLYEQLGRLAGNNEPVLIAGPVGSGKELVASALHSLMEKAAEGQSYHPLMVYRCCGLAQERAEELFAPRGVLGPISGERGLDPVKVADADDKQNLADLLGFTKPGMILIDEISDLPFAVQQKLAAWMLVNKAIRREFPVRIVASTRCDLAALVQSGRFHAGLHRLLQGQVLTVPTLSSRSEDIPMLVENFLSEYVHDQLGVDQLAPVPELSRDAQRALLSHDWPGNVRELRNAVSRAAMLARSNRIEAEDLGLSAPPRPQIQVLHWHDASDLNRSVWLN